MIRALLLIVASLWAFWTYYLPKVDVPYVPDWMIPGASCTVEPREPGGIRQAVSDAGGALRYAVTEPPPTPVEMRDRMVGWATSAGELAGTFERAFNGQPWTPPPPASPVDTPPPTPTSGVALAARAAAAAGWSGEDLVTAVAIVGPESDYIPTADNPTSSALGLWQVLTRLHADLIAGRDMRDPYLNAQVAYQLWQDAGGWSPWATTYGAGKHLPYMDDARAAVAGLGSGVIPAGWDPAVGCEPGVIPAGDPGAAGAVIAKAKTYLGVPYIRGGNDPAVGIDCSRLTELAFEAVGVDLPPVSWQQVEEGVPVSGLSDAAAGDLIFYGAPTTTHVALYLGGGRMIHAPRPGKVVEIVDVYGTPSFIRRVLVGSGGTV